MPVAMTEASRLLSSDKEPIKGRNFMMSPMKLGCKADGFERKGQAWFVATELQSDLVVQVGDLSFHLHKFPLLSRSGRLNRLVFESRDTQKDHIKLQELPGGTEAFELAAKFCYGVAVDLTASNIAALRCAAEYLEMTEDLEDGNLISKTEAFLSFVVLASWKDSITVLQSCEGLSPWAENLQIVRRCSESIAWKACTDPRGISWSFTGRGEAESDPNSPLWNGLKNDMRRVPQDWWLEDVSKLSMEYFVRVITAIKAKGMRSDLIGAATVQHAMKWLPGLGKELAAGSEELDHGNGLRMTIEGGMDDFSALQSKNRTMLENVVNLLPPQKDAASCSFLLRLLRMANMWNATPKCKADLERRIGLQLEQASLGDLLIPSFSHTSETLYDVELVQRIVEHFLAQEQQTVPSSPSLPAAAAERMMIYNNGHHHPPARGTLSAPHSAKIRVAKLIDSYLAEVGRDTNLSLPKFQALAEALPDYARSCDDGLYRSIDTYLKAHPGCAEPERKRLCRIMDCQKLSLDACMHAAQNERLPLRVVVQILFCEQVKLRNAITGSALTRGGGEQQQLETIVANAQQGQKGRMSVSEQVPMSLQEGWTTARNDIKEIKMDVEAIKSKFTELQEDYTSLQRQLEKLSGGGGGGGIHNKASSSSSWTSGWKKLSKLGTPQLFHRRMSIDGSSASTIAGGGGGGGGATTTSATGNGPATPSFVDILRPRRWRNSIS